MSITKKNKYIFTLIAIFPVIYIWYATITGSSAMRVFYFLYSSVLFFMVSFNFRDKTCKKNIFFLFCLLAVLTVMYVFRFSDTESVSSGILFSFMYFYMYIYGDVSFRNLYFDFLINNEKKYTFYLILYYLAVTVTILNGVGISYGWGTTSLQGPYGLAHIFAYELLLLAINCYLLYVGTKKIKWIIFYALNFVLMVLTSVRSTLLCALVIILYYFIVKKDYKKILLFFAGCGIFFLVYTYTPLFKTVLEKTINAAGTGDVTNARFIIWEKSFDFFANSDFIHKLFGNGMQGLMDYNLIHTRMQIHAHNEFIDILAAYGIVSFSIFVCLLKRIVSGKGAIGFLLAYGVLAWFNGIYSECSFVIGLISFRLLFERINY